MTTIQDKITYYDGSVATGKIIVTWPPFDYGGMAIAAGQQEYPIAPDGTVVIQCYPCVGAQPVGTYYTATYELDKGAVYDEYWMVPVAATTTIGAIRVSVPETPSIMINAQQLTSSGAQSGMFLGWNGSNWVPMYVSNFNCAVRSFFGRTGDVMPQTGDYTVAQVTGAVPDTRRIIAGSGLSGGGPLSADVTLSLSAGGLVPQSTQIIAGYGLTGGGPLTGNVTLAVVDNTSVQKLQLALAGAVQATRHRLNFVAGTGMSLALADDGANDEGTLTITCTVIGAVYSVFTRTGAITAQAGDYAAFYVPVTRQVYVGTGLIGGGALSNDISISALSMGASGPGHSAGIVPDPGPTQGVTRYLREDAIWAVPEGTNPGGDPQTPWASAIDGAGFALNNAGPVGIHQTSSGQTPLSITPFAYAGDASIIVNPPDDYAFLGLALRGYGKELGMIVAGSSNFVNAAWAGYSSIYSRGDLIFWKASYPGDSSSVQLMRLTAAGLGIGNITPTDPLTVNGGGRFLAPLQATNVANSCGIDASAGYARLISWGPDTATLGKFQFIQLHSDGSGTVVPLTIGATHAIDVTGDINCSGKFMINGVPIATSQTPWTSDIDGAGFMLKSAGQIGVGNTGLVLPDGSANSIRVLIGSVAAGGSLAQLNFVSNSASSVTVCSINAANYTLSTTDKRCAAINMLSDGTSQAGTIDFYTWNAAGTPGLSLRISSTGNIGVNNSAPTARLHVTQVGTWTPSVVGMANIGILSSGAFGGGIGMIDGSYMVGMFSVNGTLEFGNGPTSSGLTPRMYLDTAGNLGLGVVPVIKFQVGDGANHSIMIIPGTTNVIQSMNDNGTGWVPFQIMSPNGIYMNPNGGNVGIGTASPSSTLDVQTNSNAQCIAATITTGSGACYAVMGTAAGGASYNTGGYFSAYGASAQNYGVRIVNPPYGPNNWAIYADATAQSYFNGSVGIQAPHPVALLEVAHNGASNFGTVMQLTTTAGTDCPKLAWQAYNGGSPKNWVAGIINSGTMWMIAEDGAPLTSGFGKPRFALAPNAGGAAFFGATSFVPADGLSIEGMGSGGQASLRLVTGNYGVIFRNDGTTFYMMATNSGTPYGGWKGPFPLQFDLASCNVVINSSLTVGNALSTGGNLATALINCQGISSSGDITTFRGSAPTTGVVFFGNTGSKYLYYAGSFQLTDTLNITGNCNVTGQFLVNGVPLTGGIAGMMVQINGNPASGPFTYFNFQSGSSMNVTSTIGGPGNNTININYAYISDERLKRNIEPLTGGLPVITQLRPVTAEWNGLAYTREGQRFISVIAQELEQVIPDAVTPYRAKLRQEDEEHADLLSIDPMAITAHLILAVRQLEQRLKEVEERRTN